jgi:tetratricopeptide (TPR) repeat protein
MPPAGPFEDEIVKLSQRLAANPTSRIFAPLADAYRRAGRLSEAVAVCEQGLRHHPDYLSGLVVMGRTYHDSGDLEAANATFKRIVSADPRNVTAVRALGEIAHARGDVGAALSAYRSALELEPHDGELRERVESLAEELRRVEAAQAGFGVEAEAASFATMATSAGGFEPAARADRPDASETASEEIATATLAEIYAEQGLLDRALGIYRRLLAEDPTNARIRDRAAQLERKLTEEGVPIETELRRPAGFEPGEIRITGEEVVVGSVAAVAGPAEPGGPAFETFADIGGQSFASRPAGVPWAFLLEDEVDHDPEEVFATRRAGGAGASRVAAASQEPAPGPSETASRPADSPAVAEDDLKKFQEWLKSLR